MFSAAAVPGKDENARADDGADAQRGQRPGAERLLKPVPGSVGFGDQLVDGLAAEKLILRCGGVTIRQVRWMSVSMRSSSRADDGFVPPETSKSTELCCFQALQMIKGGCKTRR